MAIAGPPHPGDREEATVSNLSSIRQGGSIPDPRLPGSLPEPASPAEADLGLPAATDLPAEPKERGLFDHIGDVFVGGGQAIGDMVSGVVTAITHPIQTVQGIGHVLTHPGDLVSAIVNPYQQAMAEGRPGVALGRGIVEIGSLFIGAGEVGAAAKGLGSAARGAVGGLKGAGQAGRVAELSARGAEVSTRLATQAANATSKAGALRAAGALSEAAKLEQLGRILDRSAKLAATGGEAGAARAMRYATAAANAKNVALVGADGAKVMTSTLGLLEHSDAILAGAAGAAGAGTAIAAGGKAGGAGSRVGDIIRRVGDTPLKDIPKAIGEVATYPFRVIGRAGEGVGKIIRDGARNIGNGMRHIGDVPIRRAWEVPAEAVRRSIQGAGEFLGRLPDMTLGEIATLPLKGGLLKPALALSSLGRLEGVRDLPADDGLAADKYGILQTPENLEAFRKEVASYAENAIGPDAGSPEDVKELQGLLRQLGYDVEPSGTFDETTSLAVIDFKQKNGITQSYKLASGKPAINEYVDEQTAKAMLEAARDKAGPAADPANLPEVTAADVNSRLDALEKALDAAGKSTTPEDKAKTREALDTEAEAALIALSAFAAANPESREKVQAQMEDIGKALGEAGYTEKELADLVSRSKAKLDEQIARKAEERGADEATPEEGPASSPVTGKEVNASLDGLEKALVAHGEAKTEDEKLEARKQLEEAASDALTKLTRYGLAHPDAKQDVEEQMSEIARSLSEQGISDTDVQAIVKKAQAAGADTPSPRPATELDKGIAKLADGILGLREAKSPEARQEAEKALLADLEQLVKDGRTAASELEKPQAEAIDKKILAAGDTLIQAGLPRAEVERILAAKGGDEGTAPAESPAPARPASPAVPANQNRTPPTSAAPAPAIPAPGGGSTGSAAPRTVAVASGDSLSRIAQRELGDANRWREIYDLNKEVIGNNPNLIFPGQKLQLPGQQPAAAPARTPAAPAQPAAGPAQAEPMAEGEIARLLQERRLLGTQVNARLFTAEIESYRKTQALGPDTTDAEALKRLQTLLGAAGFQTPATGTFDEATARALVEAARKAAEAAKDGATQPTASTGQPPAEAGQPTTAPAAPTTTTPETQPAG